MDKKEKLEELMKEQLELINKITPLIARFNEVRKLIDDMLGESDE